MAQHHAQRAVVTAQPGVENALAEVEQPPVILLVLVAQVTAHPSEVVDDDHAHTLRDIAISFADTPETKREIAVGVYRALAIRNAFFDEMMAEIDAKATTSTRPAVNVVAQGALA